MILPINQFQMSLRLIDIGQTTPFFCDLSVRSQLQWHRTKSPSFMSNCWKHTKWTILIQKLKIFIPFVNTRPVYVFVFSSNGPNGTFDACTMYVDIVHVTHWRTYICKIVGNMRLYCHWCDDAFAVVVFFFCQTKCRCKWSHQIREMNKNLYEHWTTLGDKVKLHE